MEGNTSNDAARFDAGDCTQVCKWLCMLANSCNQIAPQRQSRMHLQRIIITCSHSPSSAPRSTVLAWEIASKSCCVCVCVCVLTDQSVSIMFSERKREIGEHERHCVSTHTCDTHTCTYTRKNVNVQRHQVQLRKTKYTNMHHLLQIRVP